MQMNRAISGISGQKPVPENNFKYFTVIFYIFLEVTPKTISHGNKRK